MSLHIERMDKTLKITFLYMNAKTSTRHKEIDEITNLLISRYLVRTIIDVSKRVALIQN